MNVKQILIDWLIPSGFQSLYSEYRRKLSEKEYQPILENNLQLKNAYKGKQCFVIGNGPSIKKQNLIPLKDEFTFVVNDFFLHDDYNKIQPNFYSIIDPRHFSGDQGSRKFFLDLGKKLDKDTSLFLPITARDYIEENNFCPQNKKYYLTMRGEFKENLDFNLEIDQTIPDLINVILACLIIASYMGFKKIYLLGCDHDWLSIGPQKRQQGSYTTHFYKKHYFKDNLEVTYELDTLCVYKLFRSYRILKNKLADSKIYNCTPNSFLDVFDFKKFEKII